MAKAKPQSHPGEPSPAPTSRKLTIKGLDFDFHPRYHPGHTLNEAEASVLNQTLAENLRNNFTKTVAAAQAAPEGLDHSALAGKFHEFAQGYAFGIRRVGAGSAPSDPVDREALKIAKQFIREALAKRKIDPKTVKDLDGLIAQKAGQEAVRAEAARRVAQAKAIAGDELDGLLINE